MALPDGPTEAFAPPDPLRFNDAADIDEFVEGLHRFERGEWTTDQFRAFRLARGVYGQRQQDVSMLRIKIPLGVMRGEQLEAVAAIVDDESRGFCHITTRQNIQAHFIKLERMPDVLRRLDVVGLTTREACGNTVRNVTGCALAGVCHDAPFDVTPYGRAIARHFLRNPFCQALPRKFKIALSGCDDDCAVGAIHDVGLVARIQDGVRGFRVRVGGGLSTSPEDAHALHDFLPMDQLLPVCEAVVRVFDRMGNRENKARARLKYVIRKIGFDAFRVEYERELAAIVAAGRGSIPVAGDDNDLIPSSALRPRAADPAPEREGFAEWRRTNVVTQRQAGYHAVFVRLVRGDVTSEQLRALARIVRRFSGDELRTTVDQNLVLRYVPVVELAALHGALVDAGIGRPGARTLGDVTSCPGADTCNLAVTQSRELASAIGDRLDEPDVSSLVAEASDLDIKISGCPNSCGQHHIAGLGFHGTMRRVAGRAVPEYQLHLGGAVNGEGARFGRQVAKVPARRVSAAVVRLLELYRKERQEGESALTYFQRVDEKLVKQTLADLSQMDETTARPEEYVDLGQEVEFKVAIGQGECAS